MYYASSLLQRELIIHRNVIKVIHKKDILMEFGIWKFLCWTVKYPDMNLVN